jgi:tRNA A37 N6-isopentenylltransferase MiaA
LQEIQKLIEIDYSIHFHVWKASDFAEFLTYCQEKLEFSFEVKLFKKNGKEILAVLKKL